MKYLFLKDNTSTQTKDELHPVYGDSIPSFTSVKVWAAEFKRADRHGVILMDYLQKGKTITGAYYASSLDKLKAELSEKRPYLQKKKILFHQDSAPPRISAVAMVKIDESRFEFIDHPPYSPDLAQATFLFPDLKIALGGHIF
ncbi:histone-lysine N-methyltransferase SETMAR [Trichonephila clavipes]|nr:histone-lysine N-methyltransferase SETMAR [Trichonephila clavipes]